MLKTTKTHAKYWRNRNIDWEQAYTSTANHPHRQLIVDKLKTLKWVSMFEIGCASGPNLLRIRQAFPKRDLGGMDINVNAIKEAQRMDRRWVLRVKKDKGALLNDQEVSLIAEIFPQTKSQIGEHSKKWHLEARDIQQGIFLSDNGVDVVLTDAFLIYVGPWKVKKALKEIKRVARFNVILVEFHSKSLWSRLALWFSRGYFAYNYSKLLQKAGFYDIETMEIPATVWAGEPWESFGYVISAKV